MATVTVAMLPDESQALDPARPKRLPPSPNPVRLKDPALPPESSATILANTTHQYKLRLRRGDYALIAVMSHAKSALDSPLLYFGEELKGLIEMSLKNLSSMQSMEVVVSPCPTYWGIIAIQPGARSCRCLIQT
jgi:hypothetical protein